MRNANFLGRMSNYLPDGGIVLEAKYQWKDEHGRPVYRVTAKRSDGISKNLYAWDGEELHPAGRPNFISLDRVPTGIPLWQEQMIEEWGL